MLSAFLLGSQLAHMKWLRDIVVRSSLQSSYAVFIAASHSEQQYRQVGMPRAQFSASVNPAQHRYIDIQYDYVTANRLYEIGSLFHRRCFPLHIETLVVQRQM